MDQLLHIDHIDALCYTSRPRQEGSVFTGEQWRLPRGSSVSARSNQLLWALSQHTPSHHSPGGWLVLSRGVKPLRSVQDDNDNFFNKFSLLCSIERIFWCIIISSIFDIIVSIYIVSELKIITSYIIYLCKPSSYSLNGGTHTHTFTFFILYPFNPWYG